jgi:hypothetical protein
MKQESNVAREARKWAAVGCVLAGFTLWAAATPQDAAAAPKKTDKPNIVYILVDNWGWGDISVQGGTLSTPSIDAFAAEGLRFTNFNVQNQCTPTRSALMDPFRNAKSRCSR